MIRPAVEHDRQPPFDSGNAANADARLKERALESLAASQVQVQVQVQVQEQAQGAGRRCQVPPCGAPGSGGSWWDRPSAVSGRRAAVPPGEGGGVVRDLAIIEAPSVLGLRPSGVEELPTALSRAGLPEGLGAVESRRVEAPPYDPRRDRETGILNPGGIARYSVRLADAVGDVLDHGLFPVVLGGDCSILLGILLALRRRGRHGLLFLDGHTDFYQPSAEPNGEAASMELALATGRGPPLLTDLEGRGPLLRDEDVVAFGFRDSAESAEAGMQPLPPRLHAIDLDAVRATGAEAAARHALDLLGAGRSAGYWVHLDADVLDDAVMPAVDYRQPGGLTWPELEHVLRGAVAGERALGLDVTIFNPRLDPDGGIAARLTDCLRRALPVRGGRG
ncbi:arginase family protein [Streptomyces phyllanthi]|uniref:arginase family protein n=1 Tax=Streptomyces phyllanthi TaxID=1803180 RepID=UPI002AD445F9|nr:arginase family protein [Streptomyces phyllanthi]